MNMSHTSRPLSSAAVKLLVAILAALAIPVAGCNPGGGVIEEANQLSDQVYDNPEPVAMKAVQKITDIQPKFTKPWVIENDVFNKIREDFYADRFSLSMCQHYMTIGEANVQMGYYDAAEAAYQGAIECAAKWVGYHIQFVTNATPQIYRTVKAFFRAKKIEVVAYFKLRELAGLQGNRALAAVYDLKSRYAKLYLDSMVALEEETGVTTWETNSYVQDDDEFLTDVETVGKILVIVVVAIVASNSTRSLLGKVFLAALATDAIGAVLAHHNRMKTAIKFNTLALGLGGIKAAADRIASLPDVSNIPSFADFRASVEKAKAAAEAGDDTAAAEAFIDSYKKLNDIEAELLALKAQNSGNAEPSGLSAPATGDVSDERGGMKGLPFSDDSESGTENGDENGNESGSENGTGTGSESGTNSNNESNSNSGTTSGSNSGNSEAGGWGSSGSDD